MGLVTTRGQLLTRSCWSALGGSILGAGISVVVNNALIEISLTPFCAPARLAGIVAPAQHPGSAPATRLVRAYASTSHPHHPPRSCSHLWLGPVASRLSDDLAEIMGAARAVACAPDGARVLNPRAPLRPVLLSARGAACPAPPNCASSQLRILAPSLMARTRSHVTALRNYAARGVRSAQKDWFKRIPPRAKVPMYMALGVSL